MKKLPKNWVETELGSILSLKNGYAFKTSDYAETGIPIVRISNIQDGKIDLKKSISVKESLVKDDFIIQKGDILIAMSGATTGKYGVYDEELITLQNQRVGNLKPYSNDLSNKRYIYYLLGSLKKEIEDRAYGGAQPNISPKLIESILINLPPLPEQNRIAEKLDNMFNQLETIKASMANIPLLLKDFRQQVLSQAVNGKLTEKWRKGKDLKEWKECPLSEFSDSRLGKMLDNAKNSGELVSYLGNINVRWFEIDFSDLKQMKVEPNEIYKYELLEGDILVCEGGEPGRAAKWKYDRKDVIFQKALHRIRLHNNVLPDYFLYNLKIDSVNNKLPRFFTGTTIKHLTGRSFSTYTILVPPLQEQQEIVRRVESLFAKADAIEQQYKTLKNKINNLPQALLHKAFKGELSEQLVTDGDARDLLKAITDLKNIKVAKPKAYKVPKEKLRLVAEPK